MNISIHALIIMLITGNKINYSSANYKFLNNKRYNLETNENKGELICGTIDEPINTLTPMQRSDEHFGNLTFKLSIYYDNKLLALHNYDENELHEYIYAIVNSVYLTFRHSSMRKVAQISISITKIAKMPHNFRINGGNLGRRYRRKFCSNVRSFNHHNMAAVLLTGYNIRSEDSSDTSVQGLAHLNVACNWAINGKDPCILVEARSFRAALIMAHELGHTLGMNHDEEVGCGKTNILSEYTGGGKTQWSTCSIRQMRNYLSSIKESRIYKCLNHDTSESIQFFPNATSLSYQSVSVDYQCSIGFGRGFHLFKSNLDKYTNICKILWCTKGVIRIPLHPALENTTCDSHRFCREGKCLKV